MNNVRKDPVYKQFHEALIYVLKRDWKRQQSVLAIETGISKGYFSEIVKGKKKPTFEKQNAIAEKCGYTYEKFLQFGKSILESGSNTETQVSKLTFIDPAVEILNAALEETGEKINEKQKIAALEVIREELEKKTKQAQEESKESIKRILKAFADGS